MGRLNAVPSETDSLHRPGELINEEVCEGATCASLFFPICAPIRSPEEVSVDGVFALPVSLSVHTGRYKDQKVDLPSADSQGANGLKFEIVYVERIDEAES